MKTKAIITEIITSLFIILWGYAAFSKLLDYETFRVQLSKSPLLTDIAVPIAIGIPAIELIIAGTLLWKSLRLLGLYASLFLMVLFTAYIIAILNFSYYIPCSCGGILSNLNWSEHIVFNLVFVVLALIGIVLNHKREQQPITYNTKLK